MSLRILRIAAGSTFQDRGRPGWRRCGVPPGGAFDRESYELALALVERTDGSVLEIPMLGASLEATEDDYLAVTGAWCKLKLNEKEMDSNSSLPILNGERLTIEPCFKGSRSYLASKREWKLTFRLGSTSGIEPGKEILSEAQVRIPRHVRRLGFGPSSILDRKLRFVPFSQSRDTDLETLLRTGFRVGLSSNRVGIRLEGGTFEPRTELVSEPSCMGVIQLAPSGELLIHGPDGPTIGGYPKLGVVIQADLDRLAQLRPGDQVRVEPVSLEHAREITHESEQGIDRTLKEIRLSINA